MLEGGGGGVTQGLWAQTGSRLVESNTLYSAQGCLNSRALAGFPTKNSASSPTVNGAKFIM